MHQYLDCPWTIYNKRWNISMPWRNPLHHASWYDVQPYIRWVYSTILSRKFTSSDKCGDWKVTKPCLFFGNIQEFWHCPSRGTFNQPFCFTIQLDIHMLRRIGCYSQVLKGFEDGILLLPYFNDYCLDGIFYSNMVYRHYLFMFWWEQPTRPFVSISYWIWVNINAFNKNPSLDSNLAHNLIHGSRLDDP